MHKALTSFLIALSIYLLVIIAVLYAYMQYQTNLSEIASKTPSIVSVDIIGASEHASKPQPIPPKKSTTVKKPEPVKKEPKKSIEIKKPTEIKTPIETKIPPKKEERKQPKEKTEEIPPKPIKKAIEKPRKQPIPKPKPAPKKHVEIQKPPATPLPKPKPIPVIQEPAPVVEKVITPPIPAPVLIHKDPAKTLALKHIPQPTPTQTSKPKPIEKPSIKPTKRKIKKTTKKSVKAKKLKVKKSKKRVTQSRRSSRGSGASQKRAGSKSKNRFIARLKARINRNKSYPRAAQRRGITGTVRVRFTILPSGRVGAISVRGPQVFHAASKAAVKRAFPIDTTKAPFPLPRKISLVIHYQ